jgi:hypothetical protein
MKYYAGLDVSIKETALCIVDEVGKICREVKVVSHPEDLVQVLKDPAWQFESGLKLDLCHNGCSVVWQRRDCRRSVLRRATRRPSSRRR